MNGKVSMKMQYKNNNQQKKLEIIIEIFRIIYWVKMVQHYYRYLNKKLQYYWKKYSQGQLLKRVWISFRKNIEKSKHYNKLYDLA